MKRNGELKKEKIHEIVEEKDRNEHAKKKKTKEEIKTEFL